MAARFHGLVTAAATALAAMSVKADMCGRMAENAGKALARADDDHAATAAISAANRSADAAVKAGEVI